MIVESNNASSAQGDGVTAASAVTGSPNLDGNLPLPQPDICADIGAALQKLVSDKVLPPSPHNYDYLGQVLSHREFIPDAQELGRFLRPDLARDVLDPLGMKNFETAASMLLQAIKEGKRIALCCDYDVDGLTSATQLRLFLEKIGVECKVFVPHRLRGGYGLNSDLVKQAAYEKFDLIVALDFGTKNIDELNLARDLKLQTVVFDHHNAPDEPCPADVLVNPKQAGCGFAGGTLCTSGMTWLLTKHLSEQLGAGAQTVKDGLALAALGTICDMMELQGMNRALVKAGLEQLSISSLPGLRALSAVLGLNGDLSTKHVGFYIGPLLNSAGRLRDAGMIVDLLTCGDYKEALRLAQELKELNEERRRLQDEATAECLAKLAALPEIPQVIVISDEHFHPGIIGTVAQRLVDTYRRPVFIMSPASPGVYAGSARGYGGFNVCDALEHCKGSLVRFGGHDEAAGFSLDPARIDEFTKALTEYAASAQLKVKEPAFAEPDLVLGLDEIDLATVAEISAAGPFGIKNPAVRVEIPALTVQEIRPLKGRYLSLTLNDGHQSLRAFYRSPSHELLKLGSVVNAVGELSVSNWNGGKHVELDLERASAALEEPEKKISPDSSGLEPKWQRENITSEARLREVVAELLTRKEIALDTETSGWEHGGAHKLSLVQLGDSSQGKTYVVDAVAIGSLELLRPLLESANVLKIEHNSEFEQARFAEIGIKQVNVEDTMLAAQELLPHLPNHKLGTCMKYILGIDVDKSSQSSDWARRPLSDEQVTYAALDPEITYQLASRLRAIRTTASVHVAPTLAGAMKQLHDAQKSLNDLIETKIPVLPELRARKEALREQVREALKAGALDYDGRWGHAHNGGAKKIVDPARFKEALFARTDGEFDAKKAGELYEDLLRVKKTDLKAALTAAGFAKSGIEAIEKEAYIRLPKRSSPTITSAFKDESKAVQSSNGLPLGIRVAMQKLSGLEHALYETYFSAAPDIFIAEAKVALLHAAVRRKLLANPSDSYKGEFGKAHPGYQESLFSLSRLRTALSKHMDVDKAGQLIAALPMAVYKGEVDEMLKSDGGKALKLADAEAVDLFLRSVMVHTGENWSPSISPKI